METPRFLTRPMQAVLVAVLLLGFLGAASYSLRLESATFDETAHLPAGLAYLERFDFRMNPEHPPLAKAWAALPLRLRGTEAAGYDSAAWRRGDEWTFGYETLNGPLDAAARRDPMRFLVPARTMIVLLGVALGLVVFLWSRSLWGPWGGLLSVALFVLSPTMLAHARLVTTDLAAALGFALAVFALWRWTRHPDARRATLVGGAVGIALLAKHSALLLGPILALLAAIWAISDRRAHPATPYRAVRLARHAALAVAVALAILWGGYGFRFAASPDPAFRLPWDAVASGSSMAVRAARFARDHRLLPEAYLYGFAWVAGGAETRLAYLDGATSIVGWPRYFPEAFALKTPPATMLLLLWIAAVAVYRTRGRGLAGWFLALPVAVYLAVSMAGHLDLGHRHLAPIYPFLFVAAGYAARIAAGSRLRQAAVVALLAGAGVSTFAAAPGYLAYFNLLGGGKDGGRRHLVDSNLDWGQDLPALAAWMRREGLTAVHLAYFGTADPEAYGVRFRKVVLVHDFRPRMPSSWPGPGEALAISETLLQGVYLEPDREFAEAALRAGAIPPSAAREWLALRDRLAVDARDAPPFDRWLVATGRLGEAARARIAATLLSTRIAGVRERLAPVARAGDSILIYRLPDAP